MEYPGVRLGQRGGLYDLYQYYLGGGDQATGDEGPVTTVSMPVTTGSGGGGGAGIDPFAERTARTYLPRDEEGFQIQPVQPGSGVFTRQYQPDNFGVDRNIATFGDAGKPILSGFTEEEKDPGRIAAFFDRLKSGIGSINLGNFPTPTTIMSKLGRPADAIYSYGGDASGVGSRAGLTLDEVRNMEYLEAFGGVDEYGRDIYGKNVVSAFGDYEQGVKDDIARIEKTLLDAQQKYGGLTDKYYDQTKLIRQKLEDYKGFIGKVEGDDKEEEKQIKARNLMTEFYDIKQKEADTTGGITETIIPPKKPTTTIQDTNRDDRRTPTPKSTPKKSFDPGGGYVDQGGQGEFGGGASYSSATAGTSAGKSSSRGRTDGGWGWKDGGLVTRKPYGDGGIVDLL